MIVADAMGGGFEDAKRTRLSMSVSKLKRAVGVASSPRS